MTDMLLYAGIGVMVGWIFLPEPAWFRDLWAKTGWVRPTSLY